MTTMYCADMCKPTAISLSYMFRFFSTHIYQWLTGAMEFLAVATTPPYVSYAAQKGVAIPSVLAEIAVL